MHDKLEVLPTGASMDVQALASDSRVAMVIVTLSSALSWWCVHGASFRRWRGKLSGVWWEEQAYGMDRISVGLHSRG